MADSGEDDDEEEELLASLYGTGHLHATAGPAAAAARRRWALLLGLLLSAALAAAPWRGGGGTLGSRGMLALREAYGRPPCAPEKPCMAAAPFDFAADGGEELHSQLLLSMEANGAAVVRGTISADSVAATRVDLAGRLAVLTTTDDDSAKSSFSETESGSHLALAPGIKEPQHRDHVQLDTDIATPVLAEVFGSHKVFGKALADALGEDAMMVELAVIRSHAGASAQQLHADTTPRYDRRDGKLWTVFIPLQNIDVNMGPLQFCAGSHSCLPVFGDLEGDTSRWCDHHCQTITAAPGDVYLIDSAVHHRGNRHAPTASTSRYVLYASFVQSTVVGEDFYPSKPYLRDLFPIGYAFQSSIRRLALTNKSQHLPSSLLCLWQHQLSLY